MLNGFSTIIFNLHRMNLDVETWEKGDNAESFDNKLTNISEKIKVLIDGNPDNDKEPRKELNKMLTEEFINGFLNSFNSLNFKQQIDFKNLIKNVLKSHKEESRFDSKYKGLLILAQNLQIDIDGPDKEPLTELRNFIDNLEENGSPRMEIFKAYCGKVCDDLQAYKEFLDKGEESADYSIKSSTEDFSLLVCMYTEFFTLFSRNLDENITYDGSEWDSDWDWILDWNFELDDSAFNSLASEVFSKYFDEKDEEYVSELIDGILREESDLNELIEKYNYGGLEGLKEYKNDLASSEWNETKPEWDEAKIEEPDKESLTKLKNFVDNLDAKNSPRMKIFKTYCGNVCNDFQEYKDFLDKEDNEESANYSIRSSKKDFSRLVCMCTEIFTLFNENLDENIIDIWNWEFKLNEDSFGSLENKAFSNYFKKEEKEYVDNLIEGILNIKSNLWDTIQAYNNYGLAGLGESDDGKDSANSEWNETNPEWDVANS